MRTVQMGNLTWPLSREQDHLQRGAEVGPERGNLSVTEHPLPACGVVPLHAQAWVGSDDFLPHGPAEDCAGRSQNLVRQDGGCDGRDDSLDVCPPDAADVQLGPAWQQVLGDKCIRLPPALVPLAGMLLEVALGYLLERPSATQRKPVSMWIPALGNLIHGLARQLAGIGQRNGPGVAKMIPAGSALADRVHAFPGAVARGLDQERQTALESVPVHDGPVGIGPYSLNECL